MVGAVCAPVTVFGVGVVVWLFAYWANDLHMLRGQTSPLGMAHEGVERWKLQGGALTPLQLEYIEWLCDPARVGSKRSWAVAHDVHESTVHRWQNDRWFKEAQEKRLAELNVSPDRIQVVIDALHLAASRGDTKAAALYLQYVDRLNPKRILIEDTRVSQMSDTDLRLELEELLGGIGNGVLED